MGVMSYRNGNVYEGYWVDNKKEGEGVETYINGDSYNGEWKNGLMEFGGEDVSRKAYGGPITTKAIGKTVAVEKVSIQARTDQHI
jgi:hypothetical protein